MLGGNGGISLNQSGSHTAHGLNGKGQRRYIQKQDIARTGITCQLSALHRSADGHTFVGIQRFAGFLAYQLSHLFLHCRDTGRTAYQKYLAQVGVVQACILHGILHGNCRFLHQVMRQLLKLSAAQIHVKMPGAFRRCRDKRKIDIGSHGAGKFFFGLFCRFLQSLHCHLVIGKIYTFRLLNLSQHPLDNLIVKVIASQMGIAVGGKHFDNAIPDLNNRDIKGTASQVINHDLLLFLIVKAVCQGSRRRLIDNTLYFQTGNLARILGCLALGVIEICRYRDNRLGNLLSQIALCVGLQLLQNHGRDLLGRISLSVNGASVVRTHISLDGRNGLLRVGHCLTLCRLANQSLSGLCKSNYRGCRPCAFRVCNDSGLAALHNCHAAICSTKVNSDNLTHFISSYFTPYL